MTDITETTDVEAAAEQAAAETAFAQATGTTPRPVLEPEPERSASEIEADAVAAEAERQKEWLKDAPQSVRDGFELVGRMRTFEGHIGGLTTVTKELRAAIAAVQTTAAQQGVAVPTETQVVAAQKSSAKWTQMQEDFPDWAEAVEERFLGAKPEPVTKQMTPSEQVEEVHEGWQETVRSEDFAAWFNNQPEKVKRLAQGEQSTAAIRLLDAFEARGNVAAETPPTRDTRARLEAAVAPTRAQTVLRREPMTEQEAADAAFKRIRSG